MREASGQRSVAAAPPPPPPPPLLLTYYLPSCLQITAFPHAILEMKLSLLDGEEAPQWAADLIHMRDLLHEVDKVRACLRTGGCRVWYVGLVVDAVYIVTCSAPLTRFSRCHLSPVFEVRPRVRGAAARERALPALLDRRRLHPLLAHPVANQADAGDDYHQHNCIGQSVAEA